MSEAKTCPPVALVTGAAHRIGRAVALRLAANGWAVALHYLSSRAEADALAGEIAGSGGTAVPVRADLENETDVRRLIADSAAALGPVTCVINNASVFETDTADTADRRLWDRHMAVNLRAPFVLAQDMAAGPPPGVTGNVINLIDQRVWNLTPHFTSYTVSKAGLWTLTQTLALALAPGVRVNAIGPGPTLPSARQTKDQFRAQWSALPLSRATDPNEICDGIVYILSAPAMTGQMIALDGGQHLGWGQVPVDTLPDE